MNFVDINFIKTHEDVIKKAAYMAGKEALRHNCSKGIQLFINQSGDTYTELTKDLTAIPREGYEEIFTLKYKCRSIEQLAEFEVDELDMFLLVLEHQKIGCREYGYDFD